MSALKYEVKGTKNKRWGVYLQDRLLATIGNYEACLFIQQCLNKKLSTKDSSKAVLAYSKAIARY